MGPIYKLTTMSHLVSFFMLLSLMLVVVNTRPQCARGEGPCRVGPPTKTKRDLSSADAGAAGGASGASGAGVAASAAGAGGADGADGAGDPGAKKKCEGTVIIDLSSADAGGVGAASGAGAAGAAGDGGAGVAVAARATRAAGACIGAGCGCHFNQC